MAVDTTYYKYHLVSREDIIAKIKSLHSANVVDNGNLLNDKSSSLFSFFMPTDEGSKLVAQLISYEGKGNVFIDYSTEKKFVDHESLLPKDEYNNNNDIKKEIKNISDLTYDNKNRGDLYEILVGKYYETQGYKVDYPGLRLGKKDDGIDVTVTGVGTPTLYIQCKYRNKPLNKDNVSSILGTISDKLDNNHKLVIWSKSGFDKGGEIFAHKKGIQIYGSEETQKLESSTDWESINAIKNAFKEKLGSNNVVSNTNRDGTNSQGVGLFSGLISVIGDLVWIFFYSVIGFTLLAAVCSILFSIIDLLFDSDWRDTVLYSNVLMSLGFLIGFFIRYDQRRAEKANDKIEELYK